MNPTSTSSKILLNHWTAKIVKKKKASTEAFLIHKKKRPAKGRGGAAYSGISIHTPHTGTTTHSYVVLGFVVCGFFRFHSVLSKDLYP